MLSRSKASALIKVFSVLSTVLFHTFLRNKVRFGRAVPFRDIRKTHNYCSEFKRFEIGLEFGKT